MIAVWCACMELRQVGKNGLRRECSVHFALLLKFEKNWLEASFHVSQVALVCL